MSAATRSREPRPGQRIGGAQLLAPMARGGMAEVWAARRVGAKRTTPSLAVKILLPALSADVRFQKMLRAEARVAARVRHPNVCRVFDCGEDGGLFYITLEWIEGVSLGALLGKGPLPCGVAVRLARDAARGLGAAHELTAADGTPLGVVHRDVSPQNIMLTSAGTVKVVDFGVAKLLEPDERLTQSGYLKGKVAYMSPEQVYCEPVDARSDVFALGVVLYEATTGRHPFAAGGQVATLVNIASPEPAVPADALRPSYPAGLAALLNRALAKNPEQRPQSMRAFASELDQLVRGLAPGTDSVARHFAVALREFQRTRAATLAHYAPALQEPTAGGATGPRPKFERAVRALSVSSALLGSLALGAANSVGPRAQVEAPSHAQPRAAPVSDSPALRAYGKPKETSAEPAPTTRPARDAKGSVAKRNPRVSATSRVRAPVEELRNDILDRRDP